jgi:multiple antibiotic resistance protein
MFLLDTAYLFTWENFLLTFIPLFVAIDAPGSLPLFIGLTQTFPEKQRRRLTIQAVAAAFAIAFVIMIAGKNIFGFLGITISDFRIAGGVILLLIAIRDLIGSGVDESKQPADPENISIVPIGIPLIAGPAVLTTLLILSDSHGLVMTAISLVLNLIIVFLLFYFSNWTERSEGNCQSSIAVDGSHRRDDDSRRHFDRHDGI